MKKLFIFGLAVAMLSACGNDPVTNAGYFDDDLDRSIDSSTHDDHSQNNTTITNDDHSSVVIDDHSSVNHYYTDTIFVVDTVFHETTDTIYKMTVDTLYKTHIDTLYKTLYDTLTTTIIDTVINTLVDTVVQRVIDTVINTMVDTVYTRVVDTVVTSLNTAGVNIETLRDTSITLTDTIDGLELSRTFYGKVYKNVFYDTTMYQYSVSSYDSRVANTVAFTYHAVGDRKYTYNQQAHDTRYETYTFVSQCGAMHKPTDGVWNYSKSSQSPNNTFRVFRGWRMFDESDAYQLRNHLDIIIPSTVAVYLSDVYRFTGDGIDKSGLNNAQYIANVVTSTGTKTVLWPETYMCAYDLT